MFTCTFNACSHYLLLLWLPGARIGHRELQRYFRQNIPATRQIVKRNSEVIGRVMTQYKALGWSGNKGKYKWIHPEENQAVQ